MKKLPPMTVVIDSREQLPLEFPHATVVKALKAGDYSIEGLENEIAIERKSLEDFVSTVIHGRDRFIRELEKLKTYRFARIVVEAEFLDLYYGRYRSRASEASLIGTVAALDTRYVPIIWAGCREAAEKITERMLWFLWEEICNERKREQESAE